MRAIDTYNMRSIRTAEMSTNRGLKAQLPIAQGKAKKRSD